MSLILAETRFSHNRYWFFVLRGKQKYLLYATYGTAAGTVPLWYRYECSKSKWIELEEDIMPSLLVQV